MSLHENSMKKSKTSETVNTDRKQTFRLYPSLPNIDKCSTTEVCVPHRSIGEKLHAAAVYHPDTQSEASAAGSDVRLKAQILILEEQRQELLSINKKWALEHRTMKQFYTEKVRGLKTLLRHDQCHFEGDKDKESTKTGDADVSSKGAAEKEAKDLRAQNSTLTRRWQQQREEIRRLNKALEEALQAAQPLDVSSETLQGVWKHQAEVYKEDFLKERRDREKLKEKCLNLEKKLRKVHSEL